MVKCTLALLILGSRTVTSFGFIGDRDTDANTAPAPACPSSCTFLSGGDGQDTSQCETVCGPNAFCDPRAELYASVTSFTAGECFTCPSTSEPPYKKGSDFAGYGCQLLSSPPPSSSTSASTSSPPSPSPSHISAQVQLYSGVNVNCGELPDLAGHTPAAVKTVTSFAFDSADENKPTLFDDFATGTNWAAAVSMEFPVAAAGEYQFLVALGDADTAQLTVDETELLSTGCAWGGSYETAAATLDAGAHSFKLTFADDGWPDKLHVSYSGPDTDGQWLELSAATLEAVNAAEEDVEVPDEFDEEHNCVNLRAPAYCDHITAPPSRACAESPKVRKWCAASCRRCAPPPPLHGKGKGPGGPFILG